MVIYKPVPVMSPRTLQHNSETSRGTEGLNPEGSSILAAIDRFAEERVPVHGYPVPVQDDVHGRECKQSRVSEDPPAVFISRNDRDEIVDV